MRRFVFLLVLVAAAAASRQVAAQTMMGAGTVSCGKWREVQQVDRTASTNQQLATKFQLHAWIDGFLSGVNVTNEGIDILSSRDAAGYYAWLDNYCAANPLEPLGQGAYELLKELKSRAKHN
ncbi:hypothetical protein ACVWWO_007334 [Bradyrhizobium sp. F1.13.1]